jgi:hypothetical protein
LLESLPTLRCAPSTPSLFERPQLLSLLPPAQSLADVDWTCDTGSEEVKEVANLLSNIFIGADPTVKWKAQYILDSELVDSFLASTTAAKPATDASRVAFTEVSLKRRRLAPPPRVADTTTEAQVCTLLRILHAAQLPQAGEPTDPMRAHRLLRFAARAFVSYLQHLRSARANCGADAPGRPCLNGTLGTRRAGDAAAAGSPNRHVDRRAVAGRSVLLIARRLASVSHSDAHHGGPPWRHSQMHCKTLDSARIPTPAPCSRPYARAGQPTTVEQITRLQTSSRRWPGLRLASRRQTSVAAVHDGQGRFMSSFYD